MSLRAEYITAIETRLRWLKWSQSRIGQGMWRELGYGRAMPSYEYVLEHADTYYMNPVLGGLIDEARRLIPDEIAFDPTWMLSKCGWLWLDQPFQCPETNQDRDVVAEGHEAATITIRAIGWREIPVGEEVIVWDEHDDIARREAARPGTYQVITFQDMALHADQILRRGGQDVKVNHEIAAGFGCWSYFVLREGQRLGARIDDFEDRQARGPRAHGAYADRAERDAEQMLRHDLARRRHPLHEIRWIYAALHIMAQRLAISVQHETDRATRRRAERVGQTAPPFIKVVTLRRLTEPRPRNQEPAEIDYQWQWTVTGHWRNQYYPSENTHKPVFIDSYIKGPPDRPLKPGAIRLYAAVR